MSSIGLIKEQKRTMIRRHAQADNLKGMTQVLVTLACLAILWWAAVLSVAVSHWLTVAAVLLISLFSLRVFTLMHECGHGSLFRTHRLNRVFGFLLGVVSGMPQYVWSRHHSYHHAHNGNWEKYRGLYTTLSVDEYAAMTDLQQRLYRYKCSIAFAPFAGLVYVIFNPRFTWLKGSLGLVSHMVKRKIAQPNLSMRAHAASFETRYWRSHKEYWHMFWNNVLLLSVWMVMCWAIGTALFFWVYLSSAALAGGAGVVLFTVQHNFKHSYASDGRHWDYDTGAIEGTSFLILPRWLNWFTANIAYHHIHHLSAKIPNYRLVRCHNENRHLFSDVTCVRLSHIPRALKYILWDTRSQRIISVAEYRQQMNQAWALAAICG
ncbi:MAG: fatty acid desaturase [Deltaproteobacteria bacterium]|nr:fatty acid desaturase [Deltaproteobacteria bacterium]